MQMSGKEDIALHRGAGGASNVDLSIVGISMVRYVNKRGARGSTGRRAIWRRADE